jgi:FkbH-like protein
MIDDRGASRTELFWRAPRASDWNERLEKLLEAVEALSSAADSTAAGRAIADEARVLANQRLDLREHRKLERLARRLWPRRESLSALRAFRIVLLGNCTLSYLAGALRGAALARGLLLDVVEAGFDATAAFALGRTALPEPGPVDAAVIVVDEAAFGESDSEQASAAAAQTLGTWVAGVRARVSAPVIVATIPLRPEAGIASADGAMAATRAAFVNELNGRIFAGASRGDWIVWDLCSLAGEVGTRVWFDPVRFHEAKTPFALEWCPLAADHLCRVLAALAGKSGRALVLDLDNTLWGGVIADDGLAGIRLGQGSAEGESYLAVQRLALELRARGVVLAVCSKNDPEIAREPFLSHPDMLIGLDQLAVFQANWVDKATNLGAIADALHLGIESLVFVDDNPAERARVRQVHPTAIVPELGDDPAFFPRAIVGSGAFEHLVLTATDRQRADAYRAEQVRQVERASAADYDEYLRGLAMRMQIARFDALGRARIAQLINKSNQFNLTTRRYNEVDVEALGADPDVIAWQVRLADAFGDHGMIAVVIVRKRSSELWEIDTWLMSCRVLERGVEQTLMNELVAQARASGCKRIAGEYRRSERNGLVADFFDRMQFARLESESAVAAATRYVLETSDYRPFEVHISVER